jgi:hypothetical protein
LRSTPVISGSLDLAYLRAALARAGLPAELEELQTTPPTDVSYRSTLRGSRDRNSSPGCTTSLWSAFDGAILAADRT